MWTTDRLSQEHLGCAPTVRVWGCTQDPFGTCTWCPRHIPGPLLISHSRADAFEQAQTHLELSEAHVWYAQHIFPHSAPGFSPRLWEPLRRTCRHGQHTPRVSPQPVGDGDCASGEQSGEYLSTERLATLPPHTHTDFFSLPVWFSSRPHCCFL